MKPINSLFSWIIKKRTHQIELFKEYPVETQKEQLLNLVNIAKDTEWGKKHDYKNIHSIVDFKSRVPIQTYEDLYPLIHKTFQGKQNILWPTEVKWFAKSSGTTNAKSKYIPISIESLESCHYKGGKDLLAMYVNLHPDSEIYSGKTLTIGGNSETIQSNSDTYYGDLSAIIIKNLPLWVQIKRIPNKEVALLSDWEEKVEKIARYSMDKNVTIISGVPSWTLVILKRVLELKNTNNLFDVWPNLELYMHGGMNFAPYMKEYKRIIPGDKMSYIESYNASEGFFAIQDQDRESGMLLMLDYGIYYEFIPINEVNKENPQTLELDEVELNHTYALVISTNGGLWRYLIGDTVTITSTYPFRIKVSGRTKSHINIVGEELMIGNTDKALEITCDILDLEVLEYTAGPIFMTEKEAGGHEWVIEFKKEPESLDLFTKTLDTELKKLNSDYESKRYNDFNLKTPVIHLVPEGTFYRWMRTRGKLGGQNKVPRLSNTREHIESLNSYILEKELI